MTNDSSFSYFKRAPLAAGGPVKNMAKTRRKRRSLKKLSVVERKNNAKKWLLSPQRLPKGSLLSIYSKRYGISENDAYIELMELGYYETLQIEYYEEEVDFVIFSLYNDFSTIVEKVVFNEKYF